MKIAFISSEANPFSKTGGLGDVAYSLSKELSNDNEVSLIIPFYQISKQKEGYHFKKVFSFDTYVGWRKKETDVYLTKVDNISFYLIDCPYYFSRSNLYGYEDDGERFAYFTLASLNLIKNLGHFDIIHCNDWQTGMLACLVKEKEKDNPIFAKTKFIFTIHNPAFMGLFDRYFLNDFYSLPDYLFDNGTLRWNNMVSSFKAGIVYADKITTVSPTHAKELLDPSSKFGLSYVLKLREDDFAGICNGIDEEEFNPRIDKIIKTTYGIKDVTKKKKICKQDLFESCQLQYKDVPTFGFVSRLSEQKGINLILDVAREIINKGGAIFALGSGDYVLEKELEDLRREYPENVGIYIGYSQSFAHKVYAGCDFFLMPSLFEPCGIGQLIALKYGTIPVARRTGGLVDTIIDYKANNIDNADGILFNDFNDDGIRYGLYKAMEIYSSPKTLRKIRSNAMKSDHSWKKSKKEYIALYKLALTKQI